MINVLVLNPKVFHVGMLDFYWSVRVFVCEWAITHAIFRVRLFWFGLDGQLFSMVLLVLFCCVFCAFSGLSQRRMGVGMLYESPRR